MATGPELTVAVEDMTDFSAAAAAADSRLLLLPT
jgi:hypothetical protein